MTLTPRQKEVFDFIKECITGRGYPPTVRELGKHCGIKSPNGVICHLDSLEKKGFIKRDRLVSRGISLSNGEDMPKVVKHHVEIKDLDWRAIPFAEGTRQFCEGWVSAMDSLYPSMPHRIVCTNSNGTTTVVRYTQGRGPIGNPPC
jgi:SOS-response transcriptional repressor LexA